MLYERKIRYLDYLVNGERIQGGGFVKLEVKNAQLQMNLAVMGLYRTDSLEREVLLCGGGGEKPIGKIIISNGKGEFRYGCRNLENIGGTGIRYEELEGVRIPLGAGREVSGSWGQRRSVVRENTDTVKGAGEDGLVSAGGRETADIKREGLAGGRRGGKPGSNRKETQERSMREAPKEGVLEERERSVNEAPREGVLEEREGSMREAPREGVLEEREGGAREVPNVRAGEVSSMEIKNAPDSNLRDVSDKRTGRDREIVEETGGGLERDSGRRRKRSSEKPIRLMDDKWQQLCAIYPHIRPFQDEREYLSIGPADFVLFPSDSYKMVNNSFLLHGYYNYNHLLLARLEKKDEKLYYVGVPGTYFEKEKQVAIMFGFESFECAEEPAQSGDFGYYMMRVQL